MEIDKFNLYKDYSNPSLRLSGTDLPMMGRRWAVIHKDSCLHFSLKLKGWIRYLHSPVLPPPSHNRPSLLQLQEHDRNTWRRVYRTKISLSVFHLSFSSNLELLLVQSFLQDPQLRARCRTKGAFRCWGGQFLGWFLASCKYHGSVKIARADRIICIHGFAGKNLHRAWQNERAYPIPWL